MFDRRKTERIFLRIPVLVRGIDENGAPFIEEAFTIEINRDGARIGLKNTPKLLSELDATNLANDFTAALLVKERCPQSYDGLPEWGVGFTAPSPEFWGIVFAERDAERQPSISALLTCQACGRQELVSISFEEYEILRTRLFLPRLCPRCHLVAKWEVGSPGEGTPGRPQPLPTMAAPEEPTTPEPDLPAALTPPDAAPPSEASAVSEAAAIASSAEQVATPEPAAPPVEAESAKAAEAGGADRRRERRLPLKVPILVKSRQGDSEKTESSDVSKNGLSFTTALEIVQGDLIEVTVGYGVATSPVVRPAKVAWRRPEGTGTRSLVGIWFTDTKG